METIQVTCRCSVTLVRCRAFVKSRAKAKAWRAQPRPDDVVQCTPCTAAHGSLGDRARKFFTS